MFSVASFNAVLYKIGFGLFQCSAAAATELLEFAVRVLGEANHFLVSFEEQPNSVDHFSQKAGRVGFSTEAKKKKSCPLERRSGAETHNQQ
jgi:hypothetical protein